MKRCVTLFLALVLFVAVQCNCWGVVVTFFGEDLNSSSTTPLSVFPNASAAHAQLLSNLVGVGTETFEGIGSGATAPLTVTFPGAGSATLSGDGTVVAQTHGTTNGVGRYAISGNNFWETSQSFSLQFSQPQAAFGFFGVDIGDYGGQITLTLTGGNTTTLTVPNTVGQSASTDGSVLYFGFYTKDPNEAFTKIQFGDTASGSDFFAFDDFTIGTFQQVQPTDGNVPEPTTLIIWSLLGAVGFGFAWIRNRKAA